MGARGPTALAPYLAANLRPRPGKMLEQRPGEPPGDGGIGPVRIAFAGDYVGAAFPQDPAAGAIEDARFEPGIDQRLARFGHVDRDAHAEAAAIVGDARFHLAANGAVAGFFGDDDITAFADFGDQAALGVGVDRVVAGLGELVDDGGFEGGIFAFVAGAAGRGPDRDMRLVEHRFRVRRDEAVD